LEHPRVSLEEGLEHQRMALEVDQEVLERQRIALEGVLEHPRVFLEEDLEHQRIALEGVLEHPRVFLEEGLEHQIIALEVDLIAQVALEHQRAHHNKRLPLLLLDVEGEACRKFHQMVLA